MLESSHDMLPGQRNSGAAPAYLPTFQMLADVIGVELAGRSDADKIAVSVGALKDILRMMLREVRVDEAWYGREYPDVSAAVMAGDIPSCREHFLRAGYFEGRLPAEPAFDEEWYLGRYPDVAEACRKGVVRSARAHFLEGGLAEGRAGIPGHEEAADYWIVLTRKDEPPAPKSPTRRQRAQLVQEEAS